MERLWSLAVATGGNRWQTGRRRKRLRNTKTVAVGCHQLPAPLHGKEGVSGSSPEEGSAKATQIAASGRMNLHELQFAMGMEPLMELSDLEVASATPHGARNKRKKRGRLIQRQVEERLGGPRGGGGPTIRRTSSG
jgi:hypothetical protein